MSLGPDEIARYARHIVLKDMGGAGQQALKAARVLVVGAGGLGSPVIAYLAAAGVGTLGVVDDDVVSLSNLQRQLLHRSDAVDREKVLTARDFVAGLNPHVQFHAHNARLGADTAQSIITPYDIVVDGSDNFDTRAVVARAAKALGKPVVSGAVSMFDGQITVFMPDRPGFDALYPDRPAPDDLPSCEAVGVLGAVTGVIGTLMAMEAIKLICGLGEPLVGRLLLYDGRSARFTELTY